MLLLGDHLNVSRAGFNYTVAAAEYLETCWQMYNQTACGLAPESVYFPTTPDPLDENPPDMTSQSSPYNYLRPETLESIFIMYRRTGDPKYREMGWAIFQVRLACCEMSCGREVTALVKALTGGKWPLPRYHVGCVFFNRPPTGRAGARAASDRPS